MLEKTVLFHLRKFASACMIMYISLMCIIRLVLDAQTVYSIYLKA